MIKIDDMNNTILTKEQRETFDHWKRSCIYSYVQSLWRTYQIDSKNMTFEEYVQDFNHWHSLAVAQGDIKIWKEYSEEKLYLDEKNKE